jgi:hypothetical protein
LSAQEGQQGEPTEEELRAAYEAELSRLTSTDVIAQAAVSLLNIGARRLAPPGGEGAQADQPGSGQRDLAQARDAIDAVRALLEILERSIPQEIAPLRDALSRLQMAYAREVAPGATAGEGGSAGGPGAGAPGGQDATADATGTAPGQDGPPGPGPAESSGRLWVPGR